MKLIKILTLAVLAVGLAACVTADKLEMRSNAGGGICCVG